MHDELGAKGVEVVGISMDEDGAEAVKPFLRKNPMKYTVGLGSGSMDQLPVTVVLDRNGNTVKRFDGTRQTGRDPRRRYESARRRVEAQLLRNCDRVDCETSIDGRDALEGNHRNASRKSSEPYGPVHQSGSRADRCWSRQYRRVRHPASLRSRSILWNASLAAFSSAPNATCVPVNASFRRS